jgi:diadenosine tetraphosphate (Ap4A) HIT family hydrolase
MVEAAHCMLCRIVRGVLRVDSVVNTARIIGFVTQHEPYARGHCVFFPKRHAISLHDMNDEDLAEILPVIKRVATALDLKTYNIILPNNGALAGQTVFHAHVHLIPKWTEADGLRRAGEPPAGIDQTGIAQRIRERLRII